jgi:hypothetical protein
MKAAFLLFLTLLAYQGRAQAPTPTGCGCPQNFAEMKRLTETNYTGFRDKVTAATRPRYDSLTAALRAQADTAHATSCWKILQQWTRSFHDGHLGLQDERTPRLNADSIRVLYAKAERLPWTRTTFRAYLNDAARPKKLLEGIWRDGGGGGYEVGIVATSPGQYKAFVLRADSLYWMPGQVKFAFADPASGPTTAAYYMRNHSNEPRPVRIISDGVLDLNGPWYRAYPRPVAQATPTARYSFQMLDDTTALYRIASFDGDLRPKIDSLTKANAANLAHTKLLILDLRGNGGGSDASYRSLIPYVYTNPVEEVSLALYSTPENNTKYNGQLFPDMSAREKTYYAGLKRRLDAHLGQLVSMNGKKQTYFIRKKRRELHPEVTRVAVLQNRYCGSTTEQFLLMAKQSKKTISFGENSYGALDYSNMQHAPLPCYNLRLNWATSRSFRLDRGEGIDNVGIVPTVRLDPNAADMVEQVRAFYRKQK